MGKAEATCPCRDDVQVPACEAVLLRMPKCRVADARLGPSLSALCARAGVAEVAFEVDGAEGSRALLGGGAVVVGMKRLLDIHLISMVRGNVRLEWREQRGIRVGT